MCLKFIDIKKHYGKATRPRQVCTCLAFNEDIIYPPPSLKPHDCISSGDKGGGAGLGFNSPTQFMEYLHATHSGYHMMLAAAEDVRSS